MSDKKMNEEVVLSVRNVKKDFHVPHESTNSMKSKIVNIFKPKDKGVDVYHALKGVSLDINKGEFFGIVGRNGSGKSTLLKIIAQIYQPTSGTVSVQGKLVPFIELGVGFNPELTGRENVFLNGALLGFSRDEMEARYDDIVKFSELVEFMDQKLKNYSSGMQVRLAFSVAIQADADILLIDEVLAVGDEAFQRKCLSYFAKLKKEKKTVVFVTHSMDAVQQFCDRVALIDKGHDLQIGSPLEMSQIYQELNSSGGVAVDAGSDEVHESEYLEVLSNAMVGTETIDIEFEIHSKAELKDPIVAVEIYRDRGEQVFRWVTDERLSEPVTLSEGEDKKIALSLQNIFPVGTFSVRVLVRTRDRSFDYGIFNDIATFEIENSTPYQYNTLWQPQVLATLDKLDKVRPSQAVQ